MDKMKLISNQEASQDSSLLVKPSLLFVGVGAEIEYHPIIDEVRRLLPSLRLMGIAPRQSQWVSPYDEIVAEESDLSLGSVGVGWCPGAYLNPSLYLRIMPHYSTVIRMADRLESGWTTHRSGEQRSFQPARFSDRHRFFLELCTFWDHVVRNKNVRGIVFNGMPHMFWDTLLFLVGRENSIPCLYFHNVRPFFRCIYIHEDPMKMGELSVGTRLLEMTRRTYGIKDSINQRLVEMESDVTDHSVESEISKISIDTPSVLTRAVGVLRHPTLIVRRILRSTLRRFRYFSDSRSQRSQITLSSLPEKFFFMELQPENNATTHVKGFVYGDQRESLAHICSSLPAGFNLVVRENSRQSNRKLARRPYFWSDVSLIPNLQLCGDEVVYDDILRCCSGVVEVGYSSIALKAYKRGLPLIVLGLSHLQELEGVTMVGPEDDLKAAIASALLENQQVCEDDLRTSEALARWIQITAGATISGDLSGASAMGGDRIALDNLNSNIAAVVATWYSQATSNQN